MIGTGGEGRKLKLCLGRLPAGPIYAWALLALHSPLSSRASTSTRSSSHFGWVIDLHGNLGAHLQHHGTAALHSMLPTGTQYRGSGMGPAPGDPQGPGKDTRSSGL